MVLDERSARAYEEQADVVEADGAVGMAAVVLQPADGEAFELLLVQALWRERVRFSAS